MSAALITMEHIKKIYTQRALLDDTGFSLHEGDKVGLIGVNGTGKSTLLKLACGRETPDQGTVVRANHLKINFLAQNPELVPEDTVLEAVLRNPDSGVLRWEQEAKAKSMLNQLGLSGPDERIATLSGGQKKRAALAGVLLSPCDVLILDEPTNHLDSRMAQWLEDYLKRFKGVLLMITHDRYFLDSVTNRIVELDKGKLYCYDGNYENFLRLKAERLNMALATERKRQAVLKKEIEWMQRGARARSTKQKAHIKRYETLRDQPGMEADGQVEIDSVYSRLGRSTVELVEVSKAYGEKVLIRDFSYQFLKNDRIGVIGQNGAGKSTLMNMIADWIKPDSGEIRIGQTVKIGYFSQENEQMPTDVKVIDYIKDVAEYVSTREGSISASQMLERFLFEPAMQYTPVGQLSGGEKRRLYLLRILMDAPNVLLLDEPTNDLDTQTLSILEDYLDSFQGIVMAVSHDRYFLDRAVNRIFDLEQDGTVSRYEGGFQDYQAARSQKDLAREAEQDHQKPAGRPPVSKKSWKETAPKKLKFTFQEQRDWEHIEGEIAVLEQRLGELEAQILRAAADYGQLCGLTREKEQQEALLEEKMERWMYLTELAERIENQA